MKRKRPSIIFWPSVPKDTAVYLGIPLFWLTLILICSGKKEPISFYDVGDVQASEKIGGRRAVIRDIKGTGTIVKIMLFEGHEYLLCSDGVDNYGIIHSESCRKCTKVEKTDVE